MPDLVVILMKRARNCPVACFLKILFLLLLLVALYLAIYHQTSVSLPWYLLFLGVIAVEAAVMLFANNNCRIRISELPE
jgi:peptidoglycan/LPS O-acetylase OafA/YrhL